ncbi:MAG: chaperone modulator CbpM [Bacteroidales bacterium]|nr:chaperone modulator CbpM [Bacteroidales bacterium]
MQTEYLIALSDFCISHNIELSFVRSLHQTGLIRISDNRESGYIEADQLCRLEKFIRFYYDLDINLEGIETISHLLERINSQQDEINSLRNRLSFYESNA